MTKVLSQIEKEVLAIVYGGNKCHNILYARKVTVNLDHRPLIFLLEPKKGIPTLAAARIQIWAVTLAVHEIQYSKREKMSYAEHENTLFFDAFKVSTITYCIEQHTIHAGEIYLL